MCEKEKKKVHGERKETEEQETVGMETVMRGKG